MALHIPTNQLFGNNKYVDIVSQDSTTYEEILQSMAGNIYAVKSIYVQANDVDQILQTLRLYKFDVNGNAQAKDVIPTVDPTQYQSTLNIKMDSNDYVLNGRTTIDYFVKANSSVYMVFNVLTLNNADFMNDKLNQNLIDFMNDYGFFEGYDDKIELDITKK